MLEFNLLCPQVSCQLGCPLKLCGLLKQFVSKEDCRTQPNPAAHPLPTSDHGSNAHKAHKGEIDARGAGGARWHAGRAACTGCTPVAAVAARGRRRLDADMQRCSGVPYRRVTPRLRGEFRPPNPVR